MVGTSEDVSWKSEGHVSVVEPEPKGSKNFFNAGLDFNSSTRSFFGYLNWLRLLIQITLETSAGDSRKTFYLHNFRWVQSVIQTFVYKSNIRKYIFSVIFSVQSRIFSWYIMIIIYHYYQINNTEISWISNVIADKNLKV